MIYRFDPKVVSKPVGMSLIEPTNPCEGSEQQVKLSQFMCDLLYSVDLGWVV